MANAAVDNGMVNTIRQYEVRLRPLLMASTPWLLFSLLSIYHYWRFLRHPLTSLPGSGDGVLYAWYFEWVARCLIHAHNPLFSHAMNAPTGFNVMWNTALLGLAILCVPLTLTIGPFATIGVLMTLSPILSAGVTYLAVRAITRSWWGAVISGLIYAFGPYSAGHFGHLNLLFAPFPPLVLWLLWRLLTQDYETDSTPAKEGHRIDPGLVRAGVMLGLALGIQFLISEEVLVLAAVVAVGGLLAAAVSYPGLIVTKARQVWPAVGLALGIAAVIVALPLAYQLFGPGALESGVNPGKARADLISFVRPSILQSFASHADIHANIATKTANGAENTAYLGWPLIVLCLVLVVWSAVRRERFAIWWTLTAAGTILLSMGTPVMWNGHPEGTGLWALVRKVPLLGGAAPVRFSGLTALLIGLLLAWSFARARGPLLAVLLAATVAAITPWWVAAPFPSNHLVNTPRFFTTSAVNVIPAGSNVMILPSPAFPDVRAMVWQARSGMRFNLVGGYSVFRNGHHSTYFARLPVFANVLIQASNGTEASTAAVTNGRASLASSDIKFIIITRAATNPARLVSAAERITGCVARPVADVILCEVPSHHHGRIR